MAHRSRNISRPRLATLYQQPALSQSTPIAGDTDQYISQDARTMPQTARGRSAGPFTACQYGCVSADLDRSMARIEVADLLRLAALAADAEAELFGRNSNGSGRYAVVCWAGLAAQWRCFR